VIKRMDSPWVLNDRSGSWIKVKPEYVEARAGGRGPHAACRARMLHAFLATCPHRKRSHALARSAHVGMPLASYAQHAGALQLSCMRTGSVCACPLTETLRVLCCLPQLPSTEHRRAQCRRLARTAPVPRRDSLCLLVLAGAAQFSRQPSSIFLYHTGAVRRAESGHRRAHHRLLERDGGPPRRHDVAVPACAAGAAV